MIKVLYVLHDSALSGGNMSLLSVVDTITQKYNIEPIFLLPKKNNIMEQYLNEKGYNYIIGNYFFCVKRTQFTPKYFLRNMFMFYIGRIHNIIKSIQISKKISSMNIDYVHSNSLSTLMGAYIADRLMIKHIWHIREFMEEDHLISHFSKRELKEYTKKTYEAIFISKAIREKYNNYFANSQVIYNGIEYDKKYKKEKNNNDCINIIMVGKLQKNKCQEDAIRAIYLIKQKERIKLHIFGDGPDYTKLKKLVNNLNLEKDVIFYGYKNNIIEFRKSMDIALVCSKREAFGRVTIEAMLYENLVIAANTGGTKEIIQDRKNGLLYTWGNVKELYNKIMFAINNKDSINEITKQAKSDAIKKYSVEEVTKKIYDIYIKE